MLNNTDPAAGPESTEQNGPDQNSANHRNRGQNGSSPLSPARLSAALFLYWAGVSVLVGFLALLLREEGYSAAENGRIAGVIAIVTLIVQPALGYVADRWVRPRLLLILSLATAIPLSISLSFLGRGWPLTAGVILMALLCEPQATLLDSMILRGEEAGHGQSYGKIRSWGPLGSALGALSAGALGRVVHIGWLHGLSGVFFALSLPILFSLSDLPRRSNPPGFMEALKTLAKNRAFLLFVVSCGFFQFAMRTATTFLGLIVADRGGGTICRA